LGATILAEPADVPNVGRVAVLRDPTGAAVGWLKGLEPDAG
jgi:predicted enzyme related to lactoylglutathione lyase